MTSQVRVLPPPPSCFAPRRFAGLQPARPRSRMPSEALAKEGRIRTPSIILEGQPRRFAGLQPARPRSRMPSEALAKEGCRMYYVYLIQSEKFPNLGVTS